MARSGITSHIVPGKVMARSAAPAEAAPHKDWSFRTAVTRQLLQAVLVLLL